MRKILAFTSIRSDYDLLSGVFRKLHNDSSIDFELIVSGAHLSKSFGYSVAQIHKDGFKVLLEIETLIDSDSRQSRIKTASLLLQNSTDVISAFAPDLIVFAGDREDTLVAAMIGAYLGIPTVHFFAGDHAADGHVDNPVRNAVSKLSTCHLVIHGSHRERLLGMGEPEDRIFFIGNPALDRFYAHRPVTVEEIRSNFNIGRTFERFALAVFHPLSPDIEDGAECIENILNCLQNQGIYSFVSYPNTDPGNRRIVEVLDQYSGSDCFTLYHNLDRALFLSLYKRASFIIGNSSSGIIEAASIPIPAINVGKRQDGRLAGHNVVFCGSSMTEISNSIQRIDTKEFRESIKNMNNPYGDGKSSERAYMLLRNHDFSSQLLKREDVLQARK